MNSDIGMKIDPNMDAKQLLNMVTIDTINILTNLSLTYDEFELPDKL